MRIVRFMSAGQVFLGEAIDDTSAWVIDGELLGPHRVTDRRMPIEQLLPPIAPVDILCIGVNYRQHAVESGIAIPKHPMVFMKAGNTLNHHGGLIPIPRLSKEIDYEGELAIVIGRTAKNVSREKALDYIFGYTIANDVSARDWQRRLELGGGQFTRGKSFDGFCPIGPWITTKDEIPNPNRLKLKTTLNDQVMQDSTTLDMVFDVQALIESLSSTMTLRPGAVILTGTPQGVGFARTPPVYLKAGDVVKVEIEKIGILENPVGYEG